MSLILDALRKIERQKPREDRPGGDPVVMEGGRRWGEPRRAWVAVVALAALALATVALVQVFRSPRPGWFSSGEPTPSGRAAPTATSPSTDVTTKAAGSTAGGGESAGAGRVPAGPPSLPAAPQEAASGPESLDEDIETVPPVRLVGSGASERIPQASEETRGQVTEIPEGFPKLVLQGTSVVDGKPVAVVNYQRVFVGDTIEGARVIQISDRTVELEYKGKRFTLRL